MGKCSRIFRCAVVRLLELTIAFLLIVYMPGLPPEGSFTANSITPPKPLEGPYTLNNFLNNADRLYVDKVHGPECFAEWNGELYASVHGGAVVKLLPNGQVTHVTKIGLPCDGYWQEPKCGRPLGIEFDKSGILYVSDAYYGIWKVNIATGQKQMLVSPSVEIEGRKPRVFNSLTVASNGDLYWTDSSSEISLEDGVFGMLLDGTGRLFHYDAAMNKSKVLLDGLWFANGVALSPKEDFVIVSETARSQVRRYYLKGEKKGTDDIFIDSLPGVPDNINGYRDYVLLPLVAPRDDTHPVIFQSIAPHPLLRKFLARILALIQLPFQLIQKVIPHYAFERVIHWVGHFESVQALVPKRTTIVKVDWSGKVLESWHNIDGSLSGISEAFVVKNQLYLGSPYNKYVGRVPVPGSNADSVTFEQPIMQEKPKLKPTEAPKTTQKPVTKKPETPETPKVTQPTKPPTQATKPPTQATKPPTQATKPPTQATKPPTQATKPPTQATQPPTQATQPPTQAPKVVKPKEKSTPPPTKVPNDDKKSDPTPIIEDIPSDTAPPKKEHLKVIRKDGPLEMPHPDTKKPENLAKPKVPSKNEL